MSLALKTEVYKCPGMATFTPSVAVTAGIPQIVGGRVCIPIRDIAANVLDELVDRGRFRGVKANEAWVAGDQVGYNSTGNPAVGTAGSGCWTVDKTAWDTGAPAAGIVEVAAAAGDEQGRFILNPDYMAPSGSGSITVASSNITNTVAETDFDKKKTISANSLKVGDKIRVRAQGIAPATNATDTLTVKLKIGGVTVVATAAVDVANNDIFFIDADVVIRTIGAGGTCVGCGQQALGTEATVTSKPFKLASTAIDTTVANDVKCTGQWSVANAGNQVRLDVLDVEIIR